MKAAALCLSLVGALGCGGGSLRAEHALLREQGPPFRGEVQLWPPERAPPADFQELALVQAVASGDDASASRVLAALERRAALLGCTVVVRWTLEPGPPVAAAGVCGTRELRERTRTPGR